MSLPMSMQGNMDTFNCAGNELQSGHFGFDSGASCEMPPMTSFDAESFEMQKFAYGDLAAAFSDPYTDALFPHSDMSQDQMSLPPSSPNSSYLSDRAVMPKGSSPEMVDEICAQPHYSSPPTDEYQANREYEVPITELTQQELLARAIKIVDESPAIKKHKQELRAGSARTSKTSRTSSKKKSKRTPSTSSSAATAARRPESPAMRARRLSLMAKRLLRVWSCPEQEYK